MKVLHIINSLKKGGAEGNLYRLCDFQKKKYKDNIDITIITLIDNGFYEPLLKKIGVKIFSLKISRKNKIFDFFKKIRLFRSLVKNKKPNIIQSWMYHSNFFSLFIPNKGKSKIYWNIRHSELNFKISKKMTIFISLLCGLFSKIVPDKIIYCSEKSINFHVKKHFYSKNKTILINNGYSKKLFFNSNILRIKFRKKYKIQKTDIVLGYAGRYAKQKNIESLLTAFSLIKKKYQNIYLFLVGKNMNKKNQKLTNIVNEQKITDKIFFLDEQKNLIKFYNGIDLLLLVSHSESFPNVIAESMLCSTPVFSSEAGCASKIIGNSGFIIKKNDYLTIAHSLKKTLKFLKNKKKWNDLKINAQKKIQLNYSIEKMSDKYFESWIY
jgi:glycosyltransferase involved in cell wall biosynthesis